MLSDREFSQTPLRYLVGQNRRQTKTTLIVASVGLLVLLGVSFTLPFNKGLFSLIFNKPSSHASTLSGVIVDSSTVLRTIPPTFYGINYVGFWDGIQGSTPSTVALSQTGIRSVRFPGGAPGDWYDWKNPYCKSWSSTSPLDLWNYTKGLGSNAQVFFQTNYQGNSAGCNTSGVAVNAPSYQADWVNYNASQGINANMEVGNEEDMCSSSWHASCFQSYITAFDTQAKAMHIAQPAVKVYGPAATNEWYWWYDPTQKNSPDSLDFFLQQEGNKTGDGQADGVSLHYYTSTGCSGAANCFSSAISAAQNWLAPGNDWATIQQSITANDTRNLPVDVSEWNVGDSDSGTGFNQTLGHALITADMIGAFAQSGVAEEDYFDLHAGNQYGILYGSGDTSPADTPNPTYFTMVLWGKMGTLVLNPNQTYSPNSTVSSYATKKDDGSVQVMAINKTNSSQPYTITYQNANLSTGTVDIYSLTPVTDETGISANYNGTTMPSPQQALPAPQSEPISSNTFIYTLPAYSIEVFDAIPGLTASPTPQPTTSPSFTPQPTLTPTPSSSTTIPGDINGDGHVNLTDLSILASNYGLSGSAIINSQADINQDGVVNLTDLSLLASHYGT